MHHSRVYPRVGVLGKSTGFDIYIREIVPKMSNPMGLPNTTYCNKSSLTISLLENSDGHDDTGAFITST